jgi:hypothetical protein
MPYIILIEQNVTFDKFNINISAINARCRRPVSYGNKVLAISCHWEISLRSVFPIKRTAYHLKILHIDCFKRHWKFIDSKNFCAISYSLCNNITDLFSVCGIFIKYMYKYLKKRRFFLWFCSHWTLNL